MVTAAAVVGGLIGARLTSMVDPDALRTAFGWFVLLMSPVILAQEIHVMAACTRGPKAGA